MDYLRSYQGPILTKGFRSLTYDSYPPIFFPDQHDTRHAQIGLRFVAATVVHYEGPC